MGTDIWAQVRRERLGLADEIEALTSEQWEHPSLCAGWRVAEVAGHLVFLAENTQLRGIWHTARYGRGYSPNRMLDATARLRGREEPAELATRLRAAVDGRYRLPGGPPAAVLAELVVHGEGMRRPLGLAAPDRDAADLVPLLDFYRRIGRWFLRGATRGLRLEATDVDWSAGPEDGDLVRGPALPLLLGLAGRASACDDLTGDGVDSLRRRGRGT